MCESYFIPLSLAIHFEKLAALRGVSKVARGEIPSSQSHFGFFQVAKKVGGDWKKLDQIKVNKNLDQTWWERRNNFCARHCGQQKSQKTPLIETSGRFKGTPSRRQLGMIMWMCSNITKSNLEKMIPLVKKILKSQ